MRYVLPDSVIAELDTTPDYQSRYRAKNQGGNADNARCALRTELLLGMLATGEAPDG